MTDTQQPEALRIAQELPFVQMGTADWTRCDEAAAELTALRADNENLRTVMIAAAEEIQAHWDAHCDTEGYGPTNLMHRLEQGIPSEYGYTAGAFAALRARVEAAEAKVAAPQAEAVGDARAVDLLRYFDKHLGTVLQEHQFNVPGGGSLAAHNVRLGLIELQKLFAAAPQPAAPAPERCAASHVCDCQESGVACQRAAPAPEPISLLWQCLKALNRAEAICDAVPNREPGHLGKLVNVQPDGTHGYREIADAHEALAKYLTEPEAAPEPKRPDFAVGIAQRKWDALKEDGHTMNAICFIGPKGSGQIDRWGKVTLEVPISVADPVGTVVLIDPTIMGAWPKREPYKDIDFTQEQIDRLNIGDHVYAAPVAVQAVPLTAAARDVLAERQRQISMEGWTPKHDDKHSDGSMALAAACYACSAATWAERAPTIFARDYIKFSTPGFRWPWAQKWWKPKSQRQDLVRAAALILAELERIDRAHGIKQPGSET